MAKLSTKKTHLEWRLTLPHVKWQGFLSQLYDPLFNVVGSYFIEKYLIFTVQYSNIWCIIFTEKLEIIFLKQPNHAISKISSNNIIFLFNIDRNEFLRFNFFLWHCVEWIFEGILHIISECWIAHFCWRLWNCSSSIMTEIDEIMRFRFMSIFFAEMSDLERYSSITK